MSTMPVVTAYDDYKAYLKARIEASEPSWGMVSDYAEAAGCRRSYLSQVLNSHVHLTPDHALGLVEHWKIPEAEAAYFCLLVDLARAATARLKSKIKTRLEEIKKSQEDLGTRFKEKSVEPGEKELMYYSSWFYSAVHVIVSIPQYRTPERIAERLNLSVPQVKEILRTLEQHQFVRHARQGWSLGTGSIHLPKKSHLKGMNHMNWRLKAVADSQDLATDGVHYTSVASMSRDDFEKLKAEVLQLIDRSRATVESSPEEDLICMTCDFFRI